ncbi:sigma-G-dependent sporulation-specific acid-soluble spore protein CsgA [Bacillus swezeyi]|uniref:sigma-G-dependent sporulation-specific acid-soluble spore protein CsgA n=1 Tax=Bacillus swezeyi TaxID=1925020 RepID=UPI0027DC208A|nr:sigma-G-dependent sporulation-specific acid-soluble spore protein CsgA [Bacillus swezeyi]
MDTTLGYLRESLSNHLEHGTGQSIYRKIASQQYANEEEFVRHLDEREIAFLNQVLEHEMKYAMNEQDHKRTRELNEVYELLF